MSPLQAARADLGEGLLVRKMSLPVFSNKTLLYKGLALGLPCLVSLFSRSGQEIPLPWQTRPVKD